MLFSSSQWGFLFALVAMTMTATLVVVVPLLLRRRTDTGPALGRRSLALPALGALAIAAAAGVLYLTTGTPELATTAAPAAHPLIGMNADPATGGEAGSMEAVAARLAERLKDNPEDVDGWRLLAQSYEVLGRADAARDAWQHVPGGRPADAAAAGGAAPSQPTTARALPQDNEIAALAALARSRPQDADAWATLAQAYRLNRRFPEAIEAYAHAAKAGRISADTWADYADALAANSGGRLSGPAEAAIAKALAQEPGHLKALWLKGSAEVEKRDYRAALKTWQQLASRMPPGSPDLRAIEGNIAEARTALGDAPASMPATTAAAARIIGTVALAPALRDHVRPDDTLFVVAKAEGGGPPYAVLRRRAADLPLQFALDDSMAMMPGRSLSTAGAVLVEARLSRSGNAMPQSGDLRAQGTRVEVAKSPRVALTLAELVP